MLRRLLAIFCCIAVAGTALSGCAGMFKANYSDDEPNVTYSTDTTSASESGESYENRDIVVGYYSYDAVRIEALISAFEASAGVSVGRHAVSVTDATMISDLLLDDDNQIDVFFTSTVDIYKFIRDKEYVELNGFESLKSKLDSMEYTKTAAAYEGSYFGVPCGGSLTDSSKITSYADTLQKYICKNIDLINGVNRDASGDELTAVVKHLLSNPEDTADAPFYTDFNYKMYLCDYFMISPDCDNTALAAEFLEMVFDYYNGELALEDESGNELLPETTYPEDADMSETLPGWNSTYSGAVYPISSIMFSQPYYGETDEEIAALVADAIAQVAASME